jgi:hypothetical protein
LGSPWRAYSYYDAFAARLTSLGALTWNGFIGSNNIDEGFGIAVDSGGNAYVTGTSSASWKLNDCPNCPDPVRGYTASNDAFVTKTTYTTNAICYYRLLTDGWRVCLITGNNITLTVPFGTPVNNGLAQFTTTGASVKVGAVEQVSGTTYNNFTNPVTYVVTADNTSTQNYIVTVTVEADPSLFQYKMSLEEVTVSNTG